MNGRADSPDWREIIFRGIESEELDYKAAQNWRELNRTGKAKFARHCMALANAKGGYIVVGVSEDQYGRPAVFTGVTSDQARSFDPTDVGNFVNRCADPAVDFDIERPVIDERQYVVFVVRRFGTLPHVCAYSVNGELLQGAFYIRTKDASSRVAYRASELHGIIQRALRNQRETLGRMLRGILYENRQHAAATPEDLFRDQILQGRSFFSKRLAAQEHAPDVLLDLVTFPEKSSEQRFTLSELWSAAEESAYTFRQRPFAAIGSDAETYATNASLRSCVDNPLLHWQAFQSGLFHHQSGLHVGSRGLDYRELVSLIAEAVFFLGQFYTTLGCDDDLIEIEFRLKNSRDVSLALPPPSSQKQSWICRIPEIRVHLSRTVPDLASGAVQHAVRVVTEIAERFNLPAGKHRDLENHIQNVLQRGGNAFKG